MKRGRDSDPTTSCLKDEDLTIKDGSQLPVIKLFCTAKSSPQQEAELTNEVILNASAASRERIWSSRVKVSLFHPLTEQHRLDVLSAIREWNLVVPVFEVGGDNDHTAPVRVGFSPGKGHWSCIGKDSETVASPSMTMNLDPGTSENGSFGRSEALHEFGHALGLTHEHQHPRHCIVWNEEAVYDALGKPPNNWSRQQVDVQILKAEPRATRSLNYDTMSIMHYTFHESWIQKDPTLAKFMDIFGDEGKRCYEELFIPGSNLSALDQALIKGLYKWARHQ